MSHHAQASTHATTPTSRNAVVPHSVIPPVPPPALSAAPDARNAPGVADVPESSGLHGSLRPHHPTREAASASTPTAPAGLPPATQAARQFYLRHTTPVPGSRSGFRQLGPVRMLVCFWEDRMSLLQIHSDARRAGHGSQAMALLVAIAERHGLHIVANALPLAHGNGCLDQRTLTEWYLGFGFQRIPDSAMNAIIYTPARLARIAGTD